MPVFTKQIIDLILVDDLRNGLLKRKVNHAFSLFIRYDNSFVQLMFKWLHALFVKVSTLSGPYLLVVRAILK
ncbi:hypothetical protein D3C71_2146760 [compost metagenome]